MGVGLDELRARYPGAETYRFGDGPALSDALLALVRAGKKRATCTAEAELGVPEAMPVIGRCDIVLDFDDVPQLVTRTLELVRVRFRDMTEEMALMEGEDEDLAGWRAGHERYYRRAGIFAPDMGLIWERFEVVEDLVQDRGEGH
ncbi:ASCH domain-containing protein [Rhodobacterales bacterium HKCCSP123]|nr:ASCH domain-containing protein [Rhodobacterales bacterium HKCCSP123]